MLLTDLLDGLFEVLIDGCQCLEHPTAVEVVLDQPHRVVRSLADHLADWAKVRFLHIRIDLLVISLYENG